MIRKNPYIYYGRKLLAFVLSVFILSVAVFYIAHDWHPAILWCPITETVWSE